MTFNSDRTRERVTLREITYQDLPAVVDVHLNSFPRSALSRLGPSIVERYYRWQLEGPHKKVLAVGAFLDGTCVGYSFSGDFNGSTSGFIKRNRNYLAAMILLRPWLLFNPLFLDRLRSGLLLLTSRKRKKQAVAHRSEARPRSYGILSIAVEPKFQKLGIGEVLMHDAEREALGCDFPQMHLTVSPENEKAVRFYERLGWIRREENGNWRGSMIKSLAPKARQATQR